LPNKSRVRVTLVSVLLVLMAVASAFSIGAAHAAPTTITAYKATIPVNVKGTYSASSWTDTQSVLDPSSGINFAVKQNGTGWLFLMVYKGGTAFCSDTSCYGGIELGSLSNTAVMGTASTPTIMILASPSFKGDVDEFVSTGEQTPTTVESMGYTTQSVCGLSTTGGNYVVQCYRPFTLKNASPYDFPTLGVGSTIEIGFAVGEYSQPGEHAASDMSTYVLTFSSATTTSTLSSTSTSSSTTSTTTSTSSSKSTTTTTTTTSLTPTTTTTTTSTTTTTPTTTTSSTTASTTTTKSTTTTSSTTSAPSSSTTSTTASTSSSSTPVVRISVTTDSATYVGTQGGLISGTVSGGTAGTQIQISITNSLGQVVYTATVPLQANGTFTDAFPTGGGSLWVAGIYAVTATYGTTSPINASKTFYYSLTASATTTVVSSVTHLNTVTTTASVTGPTSTVTATGTNTVTQTSTMTTTSMTTSTSVPAWAYGVMIVLLAVGLAVCYMVSGPRRGGVKA